ncbi:MAG: zinc ribbon domain-containing protein [Clostridia bacterium]|nr:zinc ribbon domain-containing protein [Clostridia bacterium]MBQ6704227.1 zinc ribbon domain-containing protein [Clostridia bacterium]
MVTSFTRNYQDNSTEAGFQFTFYCDICSDGFKSSFIQSETYRRGNLFRGIGRGASALGSMLGGAAGRIGYGADRATDILGQRFEGRSPEWQKEHEHAFEMAKNEAMRFFRRCPACNKYVCGHCFNEDEGLCTDCAPRQEVFVARARADAMRRNIEEAGAAATVWQGKIESKTTICPSCGKPAGSGKFCNNCGASMAMKTCPGCGAQNAQTVRFCNNCGTNLSAPPPQPGKCTSCGAQNAPGTRFCGQCGSSMK